MASLQAHTATIGLGSGSGIMPSLVVSSRFAS